MLRWLPNLRQYEYVGCSVTLYYCHVLTAAGQQVDRGSAIAGLLQQLDAQGKGAQIVSVVDHEVSTI